MILLFLVVIIAIVLIVLIIQCIRWNSGEEKGIYGFGIFCGFLIAILFVIEILLVNILLEPVLKFLAL